MIKTEDKKKLILGSWSLKRWYQVPTKLVPSTDCTRIFRSAVVYSPRGTKKIRLGGPSGCALLQIGPDDREVAFYC